MKLNKVQNAAFSLIQSDARFLYTLIDISKNAKNIKTNYILMAQPYIGVFADGAEQWCRKVGLNAPQFNKAEKLYYEKLRQGHKIFEDSYEVFSNKLIENLNKSDEYFFNIRRLREKIFGYYNVGADLFNNEFCGNTILGMMYTPISFFENPDAKIYIRNMGIIAGELAGFFNCTEFPVYKYDDINNIVKYKDYHFFKNCPLKSKDKLSLVLFSILCNINYTVEFIDKYFVDEIPQKFKFAYLQYYYLCDFIDTLNKYNNLNYQLNKSLKDRDIRNCIAHYGLGRFMKETDIIENDILKGLTYKSFNKDYYSTKNILYSYLKSLSEQIKSDILY